MSAILDVPRCLIEDLPDELLLVIINHLDVRRGFSANAQAELARQLENTQNVRALHALTLTSRRLCTISMPHLYANVIQSRDRIGVIALLLQTLERKPEYARNIKYVEVDQPREDQDVISQKYNDESLRSISRRLTGAEWSVSRLEWLTARNNARGPLSKLQIPSTADEYRAPVFWMATGSFRRESPLFYALAVVVLLAENLTTLASVGEPVLIAALAFRKSTRSGLQKLFLKHDMNEQPLLMVNVDPSCQNSIQKFVRNAYRLSTYSDKCPVVAEIELDVFDIADYMLRRIFDSCRDIRRFSCHWRTEYERNLIDSNIYSGIDFPSMNDALTKFQKTLVSLELDTIDAGVLVNMDQDILPLGSLRHFTVLQHLSVSGLVLWGDCANDELPDPKLSEILPPSLQTLKIQVEWDDDVEEALIDLLPECKAALPLLTKVECSWSPAPKRIAETLISAFGIEGVELILAV